MSAGAEEMAEDDIEGMDDRVSVLTVQDAIAYWSTVTSAATARLAGLHDDVKRGRG